MTGQGRERPGAADIVVVGAGIMGASIAFQLTRQSGRRVVVVDERPPVGGMSGRTFGQIRQHYSNALMVEMAIRGFEVLNNWQTEVGVGGVPGSSFYSRPELGRTKLRFMYSKPESVLIEVGEKLMKIREKI